MKVPVFAVHGRRVPADELLLSKAQQRTASQSGSTACLTLLLTAFRRADPGRTGFVDAARFRAALSEFLLGLTDAQTDAFFHAYAVVDTSLCTARYIVGPWWRWYVHSSTRSRRARRHARKAVRCGGMAKYVLGRRAEGGQAFPGGPGPG